MDKLSAIEFVLGTHMIPSKKVGLIGLIIADKAVTVKELNDLNNCTKTFDNYLSLFDDLIDSGLIKLTKMKDYRGVTRQHFEVDSNVLASLIEEI